MTREEWSGLLQRYEAGKCSQAEMKWVEKWYYRLEAGGSGEIENALVEERIWKRIKAGRLSVVRKLTAGLAAAMVLLATSVVLYFNHYSSKDSSGPMTTGIMTSGVAAVENTSNSPEWYRFSDGSRVKVWPGSKLQIEIKGPTRKVTLQGQAFFNVAHQKERPFYVVTSNLVTQVLGTSFHVNSFEREEVVSVRTGLVNVSSPESKASINLFPNQKAVYIKDSRQLVATLVEKPERFSTSRLYFEKSPAAEIFDALAKAYRIKIRYDKKKLLHCRLTSEVGSEDLFTVLKALCMAIDGSYTLSGTVIIIKSSGCQSKK